MGWDLATTTTAPLKSSTTAEGEGGGGSLQKSFAAMTRLKYDYPGQRQISKCF